MAVDIAPKNASGAALGVVGVASYVGAGIQDIMSGLLIEGNKHLVNGVETYYFTSLLSRLEIIGPEKAWI